MSASPEPSCETVAHRLPLDLSKVLICSSPLDPVYFLVILNHIPHDYFIQI